MKLQTLEGHCWLCLLRPDGPPAFLSPTFSVPQRLLQKVGREISPVLDVARLFRQTNREGLVPFSLLNKWLQTPLKLSV